MKFGAIKSCDECPLDGTHLCSSDPDKGSPCLDWLYEDVEVDDLVDVIEKNIGDKALDFQRQLDDGQKKKERLL